MDDTKRKELTENETLHGHLRDRLVGGDLDRMQDDPDQATDAHEFGGFAQRDHPGGTTSNHGHAGFAQFFHHYRRETTPAAGRQDVRRQD